MNEGEGFAAIFDYCILVRQPSLEGKVPRRGG